MIEDIDFHRVGVRIEFDVNNLSVNKRNVHFIIFSLAWVEKFRILFDHFNGFIDPYKLIEMFASLPFECDATEIVLEFFQQAIPDSLQENINFDLVDYLTEIVMSEYYNQLANCLIQLGIDSDREFLFLKMYDKTSAVLVAR